MDAMKMILLQPVSAAIGFVGQFIVMPLLAYLIGYLFIHEEYDIRLGLFFMGSVPAGGVSNIFTRLLNGNLNLSTMMTTITHLTAFCMMPFWIFTLGSLIFRDGNKAIPYGKISLMSCFMVMPLILGIALKKFYPKAAQNMARINKSFSVVMIIVITTLAFIVNSYVFKLLTWRIIISSCALPWFGYLVGYFLCVSFKQSSCDALSIAIETGIRNSGIAIFMLFIIFTQPTADMASAVPIVITAMTPVPLLVIYFLAKCFCRNSIHTVEPNEEVKQKENKQIIEKCHTKSVNTNDL